MTIVVLTFLVFLTMTLWIRSKARLLTACGLLVFAMYTISFACACVVTRVEERSISLAATGFFVSVLLLFIVPLLSFRPATSDNSPPPEWKPAYSLLAWPVALAGIYGFLGKASAAIANAGSSRAGEYRDSVYVGGFVDETSYVSSIAAGVWPVALVFLVYGAMARRGPVLLAALGIASSAGAVASLSIVGRAGAVYFGLTLLLLMCLCWPVMVRHRPVLARLAVLGSAALLLMVTVLAVYLAAVRRIGNHTSTFLNVSNIPVVNTLYSLVYYLGSPIVEFQDFWYIYDNFGANLMGKRSLPVFYTVASRLRLVEFYDQSEVSVAYAPYYADYGIPHNVFSGFQREMMTDVGVFGTFGVGVLWVGLAVGARRRYERRIDLPSVMTMSFVCTVPLLGLFFFSYGETVGNGSLATFAGAILFLNIGSRDTPRRQVRPEWATRTVFAPRSAPALRATSGS